jgi:hypothetical protein
MRILMWDVHGGYTDSFVAGTHDVTIGLTTLVVTRWLLPADRRETRTSRLDLGGALTATAGLALLVHGLTRAGDRGLGRLSAGCHCFWRHGLRDLRTA